MSEEAEIRPTDSKGSRTAGDDDPFVAALVHELRQPLFAIQNFARAARRQLQAGGLAKCDEHLGQIELQVERMQLLSERLRQFSTGPLTLRPCRFRDVTAEAISQLGDCAVARGITVVDEADGQHDTIDGDPVLLQQVLLNLIQNSVDALSATEFVGLKTVRVRAATEGSRLVVDVIDSGPGIVPADIPQIFALGFSTRPAGSGIGLAWVRRIMTAHQGTIRLHDHRAGQTTFRLEFPLAGEAAAGESES